MAYIQFQNNPMMKSTGDCVIRAISFVSNESWDNVFWDLCKEAYSMADMPSSNSVWSEYLRKKGFKRYVIPNTCPDCYSISEFAEDNPHGIYVVGTGTHAVAVAFGNYYDAWDSGSEVPVYYFKKEG